MNLEPRWKSLGVTPAKLVLISVLAVTLVSVLWYELSGDSKVELEPRQPVTHGQPARRATRNQAQRPIEAQASNKTQESPVHAEAWREVSRLNALRFDFFANHDKPPLVTEDARPAQPTAHTPRPDWRAAQRAETLAVLRKKGVSLIMRKDDQVVAVLGSTLVRVGDIVDGFRVTSIDREGISLEAIADEAE